MVDDWGEEYKQILLCRHFNRHIFETTSEMQINSQGSGLNSCDFSVLIDSHAPFFEFQDSEWTGGFIKKEAIYIDTAEF